ncbi:MAG: NnrS family protein [Betaproteobacteria bacterium]|nr:NnrS family protein [Betaproteobacteria bacterium]
MFWKTLGAAPHRALFLLGALQALFAATWWLLELESGLGTLALPPSALLPGAAHGWLMLHGLFPFFIFGFAFTAVPNWLDGPKVKPGAYIGSALLLSAGALLFYAGIYWPGLAAPAVLLHAAGLVVGLAGLLPGLIGSSAADKRHAWAIWLALLAGLAGELCFLGWLHAGTPRLFTFGSALAVWGCLTPIFLTVCHRMIPWFTSRVLADYEMVRPYPLLWLMLIASLGHGLLEASGQAAYTWLADLPLAAVALYFTARWGILHSFKVRLLAMLHIAFVWAALAFALSAAGSLGLLLGWPWSGGYAPLHALGIGFFGAMLIAMASRVSLGHSGHKLEADGLTWLLFWLLQLAALVRLLPDLLPGIAPYRLASLAAAIWLAAFGGWAWRYAPLYWRPRADGKPG